MNIQVNKHQLERVVIKWLDKHFGDLIPKKHKDHPESVFYVNSNNKVMIELDQNNGGAWVNYDYIWARIESLFHVNYDEITQIMKVWFEDVYNFEGVTPYSGRGHGRFRWKELTNWTD